MYIVKDRNYYFQLDGWTEDPSKACRFPSQEEAELCMQIRHYDLTNLKFVKEGQDGEQKE